MSHKEFNNLKTMSKIEKIKKIRNLPLGPATAFAFKVALVSAVTGASTSCDCFELFNTSRVLGPASWFVGGDWSCGVWFSFVWSPEVSIQESTGFTNNFKQEKVSIPKNMKTWISTMKTNVHHLFDSFFENNAKI